MLLFFDWVLFPCRLIPHIKGNVGFVFTKEDLADVRDLILANKVAAPAKAGALAPIDVFVPKGNTGLGPEKTSFFQALAIPTKIAKGTIEILVSMCLCGCAVKLSALSKSQNWPAGLWLDQSFWQWNRLFSRVFAEKPSPLCILVV